MVEYPGCNNHRIKSKCVPGPHPGKRTDKAYHCPDCGWSRVILTTLEDAKRDHDMTDVHRFRL